MMSSVSTAPSLSVTLSLNVYIPTLRLLTVVAAVLVADKVDVDGPLTCVHRYPAMVPSASVPLPVRLAELVGKVIVLLAPAFATGGWLGAAFTVTVITSLSVAPSLSVTVSLNVYTPACRLLTVVAAVLVADNAAVDGPFTCCHK